MLAVNKPRTYGSFWISVLLEAVRAEGTAHCGGAFSQTFMQSQLFILSHSGNSGQTTAR